MTAPIETTQEAPVAGVEAALASLQTELADRDTALAERDKIIQLADAQSILQKEGLASAARRLAALEEINKQLAAAKQVAEERAEASGAGANYTQASSKERWRIHIFEGRDGTEQDEVPVGINGRVYQIKRGVDVDVPKDVINVLNDARAGRADAVTDDRTGIQAGVKFTDGHRFPFRVIRQVADKDGNEIPEGK